MDFLYITKYGNTLEAYLVSIAIFLASVFVSRWIYTILRRTFCEWVFSIQNVFDKQNLYRLTNLFTLLIPAAAFYFAKMRLHFEKELSTWLHIATLVFGQMVFLLILATVLEPLAEVILIKSARDFQRRDQRYLQIQKQSIDKTRKHIRVLTLVFILFIPGLTIASNITTVPTFMWVAPVGIFIFEILVFVWIPRTTKRSLQRPEDVDNKMVNEIASSAEVSKPLHDPDLEMKETIARFFLDVFKHNVRALQDSQAEIRLIDALSFAPNYIYELRVMKNGDWQSRRMTIGPIGENAGSRSKCFYVIYDYHLVIKIPPTPINDLNTYMDILKKERRIVKRLSMKECIIPSAAVILRLIQRFNKKGDLPAEDKEDDYLKFLNIFTELQKYLRIDNTFVFFMDLSKYYFLSHIIQAFHDTEKKSYDEMRKNSEVIGDYRKFEDRYGSENVAFFLAIDSLYKKYDSDLKKLIQQFDLPTNPSTDQAKTWFFVHLMGERVKHVEEGMSAEFIVAMNRLLDETINENLQAIQAYRDNIRKSIHQTAFAQNKGSMEGIITNLLELLAHLGEKKVAMRDLKPDNLLVAGSKSKYPGFLAYPQEYKIGLIDVETAVLLEKVGGKIVDQPPLGGTPEYATPSQFFENTLLAHFYDDLHQILHLQDWYAILAIIYRVITGLPLFDRTAGMMLGILRTMRGQKGREHEHFHSVQEAFWRSAVGEIKEKMARNKEAFKSVNVQIFDRAKKMFGEIASDERQRLADGIDSEVNAQGVPMSARGRQLLISCSHQKTKDLRKKWESDPGSNKKGVNRPRVIFLLKDLESRKLQMEMQTQMLHVLEQPAPSTSAYYLLEFMFGLILNRMNGAQWAGFESTSSTEPADGTVESSSQATISITSGP